MLPMFLAVADQTIVATALPVMAAKLGGIERAPWIVLSYLIAATIAAPVYGRLGDMFGRRNMMLMALVVFMAGSVLCALSANIEMLAVMRVLQGLGGGGLMALSQALIGEAVPPRERGRFQGYLAAVVVTSNSFGPFAGGYLTQFFGWESIFLVNVPLGLCAMLLVLRLERHSTQPGRREFDIVGLALFATFVAAAVLGLEQLQRFELRFLPISFALVGIAAVAAILLLWQEKRSAAPLLPMSLLRNPNVWRCDALAACHGAALVSLITFLPIYLRALHGTTPGQTGLLILPLTIGVGAGSILTGRLITRTGHTALFPSYGLVAATLTLLLLAFYSPRMPLTVLPWLLGTNAFFMGTVMGVVQVTVQIVAGPQTLGAGAASVQFSRSVGAALGTAAVSVVLFSVLSAMDPGIATKFTALIEQGPEFVTLTPGQEAIEKNEIAIAFRAAFIAIAAFTAAGACLAWTMPMRRVPP
jgi:EmrB/QacA subfamily drug resistance transporter